MDVAFVDPTARIINEANVYLGRRVYVAPFAVLEAGSDGEHAILVGDESNVQDNVTVEASWGPIQLGERVILAHGATVKGPAGIG